MNAPRDSDFHEVEVAQSLRALLPGARVRAGEQGRGIPAVLEEEAGCAPDDFVRALGTLTGLPALSMAEMDTLEPAFTRLPYSEAQAREMMLFKGAGGDGWVAAIADPFNLQRRAWLEERLDSAVQWRVAHATEIQAYLTRQEQGLRAMDDVLEGATQAESGGPVGDLSLAAISAHTSPVVKLVDSTLYDALNAHASDIHLESGAGGMQIKYRLDGVLVPVGMMPGVAMAEQLISRIKVMAELDIAERRVPQDGRFKVNSRGREIDFRVSIMPSVFGEDAVLRVLDKQGLAEEGRGITLDSLGFSGADKETIKRLASEPYGMLLVTGPTGSGKTTSLYAAIGEVNDGQHKFITIEDPVEYQLAGVVQIPVNERKGLTFARGLRSILRHDPDRIMVGEIRDTETAQIAVQSALTGHLVFTTVHANSTFDVIGRFLHMGVDPYSFVSALNGIVAQRLIRLNCTHCAAPMTPSAEVLARSSIADAAGFDFREGTGCAQCRGTGYRGRRAIVEIMVLDDELREMIVTREPVRKLKEAARARGTRTLREAGMALVRQGVTSITELNRVTLTG
ncbi:MAG TPA: GspE/PulE family protein [Burkholderiales bacterium]|jgi:general secretion pathway protein E